MRGGLDGGPWLLIVEADEEKRAAWGSRLLELFRESEGDGEDNDDEKAGYLSSRTKPLSENAEAAEFLLLLGDNSLSDAKR